jgi:hypothetical protein
MLKLPKCVTLISVAVVEEHIQEYVTIPPRMHVYQATGLIMLIQPHCINGDVFSILFHQSVRFQKAQAQMACVRRHTIIVPLVPLQAEQIKVHIGHGPVLAQEEVRIPVHVPRTSHHSRECVQAQHIFAP